jgi:hypothetical protein
LGVPSTAGGEGGDIKQLGNPGTAVGEDRSKPKWLLKQGEWEVGISSSWAFPALLGEREATPSSWAIPALL